MTAETTKQTFSVYKDSMDVEGHGTISIESIHRHIIDPKSKLAERIEKLRSILEEQGKDAGSKYKQSNLPAFTPAGIFNKRNAEGLRTHSGCIVLDIDNIKPDPASVIKRILADKHTLMCFRSPSGLGLKILCRVNPIPTDRDSQRQAWEACLAHYYDVLNLEADPSGKDLPRLCYFSHDPLASLVETAVPIEWTASVKAKSNTQSYGIRSPEYFIEVLGFIDPSDYDAWVKVGMGLKAEGAGISIWQQWSQGSEKYKEGDCEKRWKSFVGDGVTWGTVVHTAQQSGYTGNGSHTTAQAEAPTTKPAEPLVKNVVFPESAYRSAFDLYRRGTHGINEVCPEYNFGSLVTTIGASLGRSVYLGFGDTKIYPNFFTLLIGRSALARKTTAQRQAISVLREADPNVEVVDGIATAEGLIGLLAEPAPDEREAMEAVEGYLERLNATSDDEGLRVLFRLSEQASLLKKAKQGGSEGIIQRLTDVFDNPRSLRNPTRNQPLTAINPSVSMLSASTKEWYEESLSADDIRGGFANRFCYFVATPMPKVPRARESKSAAINALVALLTETRARYQGKHIGFTWDEESGKFFDDWYIKTMHNIENVKNELAQTALVRVDLMVKKLALIYAVIENNEDDKKLHLTHIQTAAEVGEYWIEVIKDIYSRFAKNDQSRAEQWVIAFLERVGGTEKRREAQRHFSGNAEEFNKAVRALHEAGVVDIDPIEGRKNSFTLTLK